VPAPPSFDKTAPLGRLTLLVGAYAPMLAVLGLRIGPDLLGIILCAVALAATIWWLWFLLRVVKHRQAYNLTLKSAEPADRDVTAYVATYVLPVIVGKPEHITGYLAYGLAGFLILVVAYRADLGAINPLAYLCRYRAYRVSAEGGARIVLSRSQLIEGNTWQVQEVAGMIVAKADEPSYAQPEGIDT